MRGGCDLVLCLIRSAVKGMKPDLVVQLWNRVYMQNFQSKNAVFLEVLAQAEHYDVVIFYSESCGVNKLHEYILHGNYFCTWLKRQIFQVTNFL